MALAIIEGKRDAGINGSVRWTFAAG